MKYALLEQPYPAASFALRFTFLEAIIIRDGTIELIHAHVHHDYRTALVQTFLAQPTSLETSFHRFYNT